MSVSSTKTLTNKSPCIPPGCEDIIADSTTVDNLISTLAWSQEPHGSTWVHRQALHFLQDEFLQVAHSPVLVELNKAYMIEAIRSDFLQVSVDSSCDGFGGDLQERFSVQPHVKLLIFTYYID